MKRIITLLLTSILIMSCFVVTSEATTKSSTVYTQVYKVKNTVYCVCHAGIYKVNKNTNSVTRLKKNTWDDTNTFTNIRYKNGYIYYYEETSEIGGSLNRVGVKSKKVKTIDSWMTGDYKIDGNKIYVCEYYVKEYENGDYDVCGRNRSMNLDGSNKRKTSVKVNLTRKKSNASGYYVVTKKSGNVSKYYLHKPSGKLVYLGKCK